MIHYHGGPITPLEVAAKIWRGRHAFISYAHPGQLSIAAEVCSTFGLDNGAFSAWKAGKKYSFAGFRLWADKWLSHPGCDFAIIPDVIDGSENENDALLSDYPITASWVPVYHLHESLERLERLCAVYPRVAIGSSGQYSSPGTKPWWGRISQMMRVITDHDGVPICKLHGLRMLNPAIYPYIPFSSVDSTTVARNINMDTWWNGTFSPKTGYARAVVLAENLESGANCSAWIHQPTQEMLI